MRVTIITVSYNSEKTIEDTIESILNQTYKNIEYIIVDGKSKDKTLEIVKSYENKFKEKKIEYKYLSEKDKGLYNAMNKGIKLATGEVIGILNSDDLYLNNQVIEKIVENFKEKKVDSLYADLVFVDKDNTDIVKRVWISGKKRKFKLGWSLPHPTFFLKKEYYNKFGLYNDEYKISSDYDLLLRMLEKEKLSCYYLNEIIVKMRLGGKSTSSIKDIILGNRECIDSWRRNNLKIGFYTIPLKLIRKLIQKFKN